MTAELVTPVNSKERKIIHKREDIDFAAIKTALGKALEIMKRDVRGTGYGGLHLQDEHFKSCSHQDENFQ